MIFLYKGNHRGGFQPRGGMRQFGQRPGGGGGYRGGGRGRY